MLKLTAAMPVKGDSDSMKINGNFQNLKSNYLFAEIAKRKGAYVAANPKAQIISLGIGDVTLPLPPAVVSALRAASEEMGQAETFHGYGEYEGEAFLREAIANHYASRGIKVGVDEIFVSDGAKSDAANILDLFSQDNAVLVPDPVYPVYVDTNIMDGRKVGFINATE